MVKGTYRKGRAIIFKITLACVELDYIIFPSPAVILNDLAVGHHFWSPLSVGGPAGCPIATLPCDGESPLARGCVSLAKGG
jgi:hypothetical protein